ncbi:hypothetical protein DIPPA_05023 [Diplonema papillatum]|nr:hypothetical protein DIPPA_05023 [Diplonema papillatum]
MKSARAQSRPPPPPSPRDSFARELIERYIRHQPLPVPRKREPWAPYLRSDPNYHRSAADLAARPSSAPPQPQRRAAPGDSPSRARLAPYCGSTPAPRLDDAVFAEPPLHADIAFTTPEAAAEYRKLILAEEQLVEALRALE